MKLEMKQTEMREIKLSLEVEKEQMRQELLRRHGELETMADRLKRTEQQLRDAQQEAQQYERRNEEYSSGLAEVRQKVCISGCSWDHEYQPSSKLTDFNGFCTGRTAGHPPGDVPAEEPGAAGGEQCPQREDLQPGAVRRLTLNIHLAVMLKKCFHIIFVASGSWKAPRFKMKRFLNL